MQAWLSRNIWNLLFFFSKPKHPQDLHQFASMHISLKVKHSKLGVWVQKIYRALNITRNKTRRLKLCLRMFRYERNSVAGSHPSPHDDSSQVFRTTETFPDCLKFLLYILVWNLKLVQPVCSPNKIIIDLLADGIEIDANILKCNFLFLLQFVFEGLMLMIADVDFAYLISS